ncbi:MAG: Rid family hydrolase [Ginsengibacter sp.]
MDIKRIAASPGRSKAVSFEKLIWAVANASSQEEDFSQQVDEMFQSAVNTLSQAGSGIDKLLSVQIFLADIKNKEAFDGLWYNWIGTDPHHWPQRICIEARLAAGLLVEMQIVATL